jgi:hypothetical protein
MVDNYPIPGYDPEEDEKYPLPIPSSRTAPMITPEMANNIPIYTPSPQSNEQRSNAMTAGQKIASPSPAPAIPQSISSPDVGSQLPSQYPAPTPVHNPNVAPPPFQAPKIPQWKRIAGGLAMGLQSFKSPEAAQETGRELFEEPREQAYQQYKDTLATGEKERGESAQRNLQQSEMEKNTAQSKEAEARAANIGKTVTVQGPNGPVEIPVAEWEKLEAVKEQQKGAGERTATTVAGANEREKGREKTTEDVANERTKSAQIIAKGHDLVSTENARVRSDAANDPNKLTQMMKTQKQQAQATLPQIDKALDETEKVAGLLGPGEGRWNNFWQGKVGVSDPQYAHYKDEIGMVQTAVTLAHARGRMSNQLFDHFVQMFDAGKQSPENMIQALNVAKEWLGTYANMGEPGSTVGNTGNNNTPTRPKGVPDDAKWNSKTRTWDR